jgi:hypothetical protein
MGWIGAYPGERDLVGAEGSSTWTPSTMSGPVQPSGVRRTTAGQRQGPGRPLRGSRCVVLIDAKALDVASGSTAMTLDGSSPATGSGPSPGRAGTRTRGCCPASGRSHDSAHHQGWRTAGRSGCGHRGPAPPPGRSPSTSPRGRRSRAAPVHRDRGRRRRCSRFRSALSRGWGRVDHREPRAVPQCPSSRGLMWAAISGSRARTFACR